jgi:hypothetical protein
MPGSADQAQELADLFTRLGSEVDAYRSAHYDELSPRERDDLEEYYQQLCDFHDQFAGDAIQDTIDAMQGDLGKLTSITQQATDALKHLKFVEQIVNVVSAAAMLAEAIATGAYGEIPEAVRSLAQALQPGSDQPSTEA